MSAAGQLKAVKILLHQRSLKQSSAGKEKHLDFVGRAKSFTQPPGDQDVLASWLLRHVTLGVSTHRHTKHIIRHLSVLPEGGEDIDFQTERRSEPTATCTSTLSWFTLERRRTLLLGSCMCTYFSRMRLQWSIPTKLENTQQELGTSMEQGLGLKLLFLMTASTSTSRCPILPYARIIPCTGRYCTYRYKWHAGSKSCSDFSPVDIAFEGGIDWRTKTILQVVTHPLQLLLDLHSPDDEWSPNGVLHAFHARVHVAQDEGTVGRRRHGSGQSVVHLAGEIDARCMVWRDSSVTSCGSSGEGKSSRK